METNELLILTQSKSALTKEYVFLKKQMHLNKSTENNINTNEDFICDLVDKQYLFIQELFNKYNELQSQFSYRKMLIENKADIFKEIHSTVLNRLLEKNYKQENQIRLLTDELNAIKTSKQPIDTTSNTDFKIKERGNNQVNSQKFLSNNNNYSKAKNAKEREPLIQVIKKKSIDVYKYTQVNNRKTSCSSSNTTTTSHSKFKLDKTPTKIEKVKTNEIQRKQLTSTNISLVKNKN